MKKIIELIVEKPRIFWLTWGTALGFLVVAAVILAITSPGKNRQESVPDSINGAGSQHQILSESKALINRGNYKEAAKQLLDYIDAPSTSREDKYQAVLQLANVYLNEENYETALEQYKKAEELSNGPDALYVVGIASVAEKLGDNATAVEYYKKAIALLKTDDARYRNRKSHYETKIKTLENAQ